MGIVLDYTFGKKLYAMRGDAGPGSSARLWVLHCLMGHADPLLRAYPSVKTIMEETGINDKRAVAGALQWLFEHKAIYNVPSHLRTGEEAKLSPRKYVFQLTGVIELDGEIVPYLYFKPEVYEGILQELRDVGAEEALRLHGSLNEPLDGSSNERSLTVPQSSSLSFEVIPTTDDPPELVDGGPAAQIPKDEHTQYRRTPGPPPTQEPEETAEKDDISDRGLTVKLIKLNGNKRLPAAVIKAIKRRVTIRRSGEHRSFPPLVDCYDDYLGFPDFVEERWQMLSAIGKGDVKILVANLQKFDVDEEKKWPGWLKWEKSNKSVINQKIAKDQPVVTETTSVQPQEWEGVD